MWVSFASLAIVAKWLARCRASSSHSCRLDDGEVGARVDDDLDVLAEGAGPRLSSTTRPFDSSRGLDEHVGGTRRRPERGPRHREGVRFSVDRDAQSLFERSSSRWPRPLLGSTGRTDARVGAIDPLDGRTRHVGVLDQRRASRRGHRRSGRAACRSARASTPPPSPRQRRGRRAPSTSTVRSGSVPGQPGPSVCATIPSRSAASVPCGH